jgi:predicted TIM-barrel fold metal-dependent hydrolase
MGSIHDAPNGLSMKFTTQPWDDLTPKEFMNIIDMMGSEDMIMYASDYPHWDFDAPERTIPAGVPQSLRDKILFENARDFYRL